MRFLKLFICFYIIAAAFGCKKDDDTIDTTPRFYFVNGGTTGFDNNLVLFASEDTITYNIVISSTYLPSKEVNITLSVQDSARQSYNLANSTNYQLMPSSAYSFQTSVTATTESVYDTIPVKLNKQFLSGADYMLPIVITSISDYKLDTSLRVIYLHTSANLLSGIYTSNIVKTLYTSDSTVIDTMANFTLSKDLVPLSATQAELDYAELGANGWKYILTVENGSLTVEPNDVIKSSVQPNSFTVIEAAADAATKDIYIKSSYKNLSGNKRIVEESLTLQK